MLLVGCDEVSQPDASPLATIDMGTDQIEVNQALGLPVPSRNFAVNATRHFAQWSGSMHAYASKDPVFIAMVNKGIDDTGGQIDQFCFQCHTPTASKLGLTPVVQDESGAYLDADLSTAPLNSGVPCVGCHMVERVNATENAQPAYSTTTCTEQPSTRRRLRHTRLRCPHYLPTLTRVRLYAAVVTTCSIQEELGLRRHSANGMRATTISPMIQKTTKVVSLATCL